MLNWVGIMWIRYLDSLEYILYVHLCFLLCLWGEILNFECYGNEVNRKPLYRQACSTRRQGRSSRPSQPLKRSENESQSAGNRKSKIRNYHSPSGIILISQGADTACTVPKIRIKCSGHFRQGYTTGHYIVHQQEVR